MIWLRYHDTHFPLRERAVGASSGETKNPPDFAAGFGKSFSVIYLEIRPCAAVRAIEGLKQ
jgi:hypothetical protein